MVLNEFEMMLYQEIVKKKLKPLTTQATKTELVPLKKGQSIENALFDVEDDVQKKPLRMTKYIHQFVLDQFV